MNKEKSIPDAKIGTQVIWSGEKEMFWKGASTTPISLAATYVYDDIDECLHVAKGIMEGKKFGYYYGRVDNPTVSILANKIKDLENADNAICFSTGMAAINNIFFGLLSPRDRIVSIQDTYGGTSYLFMNILPHFNIEAKLCDTHDHGMIEEEIAKGCKLVYLESPTNPTLKIVDIQRIGECAKKAGAIFVVDNTFATPINQKPLALGADLVVHSATKYLGGHSDVMGGIVCGAEELIAKIHEYRCITGSNMDPMTAYLIIRSIKTLKLRVMQHNKNALEIARFLETHPKVTQVNYPGLESHPHHDIAKKQMRGFGGMLSFAIDGDFEDVKKVLAKLQYAYLTASLGSVETLAGVPATTSHVECTPEERKALGIPENLIRYSTGIEETEDLIADLEQALKEIS